MATSWFHCPPLPSSVTRSRAAPLPIDPLLPGIISHLKRERRLVLRAPPGAGKTTRVPAALLDAEPAGVEQILVLEPRRIAARAAAEYVAAERGGRAGEEIGYRVRFEKRGGPRTRLWFLTEGVFGRQLARDPFLEQVAVVVLDEFHERHLQGDVALAVARELQESVRPDLALLVMSATLETEHIAAYLGGCPILTSEGRSFPVRIEHDERADDRPLAGRVLAAVRRLLAGAAGDILVFLPGAAEIRRAAEALDPLARAEGLAVLPLHGDLPLDAQQRALRPGPQRKVVLATNVAETALTIEGVTGVVDSGLARIARFDPRHGINVLRVAAISRASAEQRAGRAGRIAPGRCLRLWTAAEDAARREREIPEIRRLELSAALLELRAWGLREVTRFAWLDAPSPGTLRRAERLLALLGAVEQASGALTETGRRMLEVSAPPRLARLLIEAERRGCGGEGALLAALASERDICLEERAFGPAAESRWPAGPSDLLARARLFSEAARAGFDSGACRSLRLDPRALHTVDRVRRQLSRSGATAGGPPPSRSDEEAVLRCILAGFPDRVVRRRAPGSRRGVMVGGTGVELDERSAVRDAELFVAVEVESGARRQRPEALVRLASAIERRWLGEMFPGAMRSTHSVEFDAERERVVERRRELFHDLMLSETTVQDVDRGEAGGELALAASRDPLAAAGARAAARRLLARLRFLAGAMPDLGLPDVDALAAATVEALCTGKRSFAELRRADLVAALRRSLSGAQARALERDAPDRYRLPSGRLVEIRYEPDRPPAVAARIQEVFGLAATPRLAGGRVPLLIELLAPNHRPVQITGDLESFWRRTYAEVRKELRGRYPKHPWPEDPLAAAPTSRVGRRKGG
jgi:ATP-dependent helicase HrpB